MAQQAIIKIYDRPNEQKGAGNIAHHGVIRQNCQAEIAGDWEIKLRAARLALPAAAGGRQEDLLLPPIMLLPPGA